MSERFAVESMLPEMSLKKSKRDTWGMESWKKLARSGRAVSWRSFQEHPHVGRQLGLNVMDNFS